MYVISFIFFFIAIVMLLHIILAYSMYAKTMYTKNISFFKKLLKITLMYVVVLLLIMIVKVFTNNTICTPISDFINGIVIGYIVKNIYIKYL